MCVCMVISQDYDLVLGTLHIRGHLTIVAPKGGRIRESPIWFILHIGECIGVLLGVASSCALDFRFLLGQLFGDSRDTRNISLPSPSVIIEQASSGAPNCPKTEKGRGQLQDLGLRIG